MAKEAFYFSHDTGARNDPKLQKVLMKLGHTGKSVFWDLVEMLHEEGGYLQLSECENYAFALRTDTDCIKSLVNDFSLFENDGVRFWSESALRRIRQREAKSKKAAESALSRWKNANASKTDANALRPESEGNAIKERKGKENTTNVVVLSVLSYLNEKSGKDFKANSKKNISLIAARLNDGYVEDDFKRVIDCKVSKWLYDTKMQDYLRPETLFGTKFEGYLNECKEPLKKTENYVDHHEYIFGTAAK